MAMRRVHRRYPVVALSLRDFQPRRIHVQVGPDDEDKAVMAAQRDAYLQKAASTQPKQWPSSQVALEDNTDEVIAANHALIAYEIEAQTTRDELTVPRHPDDLVPYHARVNKHSKLLTLDLDDPDKIRQKESLMALPPPKQHPWVEEQPIGKHILHGDGQLGVHGSGEVGFEEGKIWKDVPGHYRGVNYQSNLGLTPPQVRGYVNPDTVVKHSLNLTGKGIFVTHPIKKGDLIMLVRSTAIDLGFNSYTDRLVYMVRDILTEAHEKRHDPEFMDYLHIWVSCGQQSSRVEYWPRDATQRVLRMIGGKQVLDDLQLHENHVARIAATVELNSFVVEGFFNEDKGKGYWPEAGLLNHSCIPNADYAVMTLDDFVVSDFNPEIAKHKAAQAQSQPDHHVHDEHCGCHDKSHSTTDSSSSGASHASRNAPPASTTANVANLIRAFATKDHKEAKLQLAAYEEKRRNEEFRRDRTTPGEGHVDEDDRGTRTVRPSPDTLEELAELRERDPKAHIPTRLEKVISTKAQSKAKLAQVLQVEAETEMDRAQAEADAEALLGYRRNDYVFACRATRDLAEGEEVLISYVPPEWRHEYRQLVLHERYRFWCRCPRCTPPVEYRSKTGPRFMMFLLMIYFFAQLALYAAQLDTLDMNAAVERGEDTVHAARYLT